MCLLNIDHNLTANLKKWYFVTYYVYRVNHKFGNALFCWLRVSWWKEGKNFGLKWKVQSIASKWHQLCFGAMSNIGVGWNQSHKRNVQIAASEFRIFEIATKCCFLQNMVIFLLLFTQFDCTIHFSHDYLFDRIDLYQHTKIDTLEQALSFQSKIFYLVTFTRNRNCQLTGHINGPPFLIHWAN